jgi:DNA-binding transcriptional LysR family regulator
MELRQLRYFVTLAEELHFGRAAAREHIVQSALSQQVQRLERELGVRLLERTTHHVSLTAAGVVFLAEARQILTHVDRATVIARSVGEAPVALRVGVIDSSYDSMPQILHEVQARYPGLVIHQVEATVPEQYQQLIDGRLDVGIGRAALAPPQVASHLFRRDPLGVLVPRDHRFATLDCSPKRSGRRNSTSSPSRCAGPPGSLPPCTRARWRASARPPAWSARDAACTVCRPPASLRSPAPSGGR